jgi:hypothetical protein
MSTIAIAAAAIIVFIVFIVFMSVPLFPCGTRMRGNAAIPAIR